MSNKPDGGPAFPATEVNGCNSGVYGLSQRDYFAAKAMQGLLASKSTYGGLYDSDALARDAWKSADAMLKWR